MKDPIGAGLGCLLSAVMFAVVAIVSDGPWQFKLFLCIPAAVLFFGFVWLLFIYDPAKEHKERNHPRWNP